MKRLKTLFAIVTIGLLTQCQQQADTRAADEAAIRQADIEWSKAAQAKDLDAIVSYYIEKNLILLPPNAPMIFGKDSARELNQTLINLPGYTVNWQPDKVEVARSGDIGYVVGNYVLTTNDTNGVPITDKGKYIEIWKKQTDGSWKVAVEMLNSDLPLVAK